MHKRGDVDRAALLSSRKISRHGNDCHRLLIAMRPMRLERDYEGKEGTRGESTERLDWKFGGRAHDSRVQTVGFRLFGRKWALAAGAHTWRR
jgi:hypothetical protein